MTMTDEILYEPDRDRRKKITIIFANEKDLDKRIEDIRDCPDKKVVIESSCNSLFCKATTQKQLYLYQKVCERKDDPFLKIYFFKCFRCNEIRQYGVPNPSYVKKFPKNVK